ncbi:ribosomal protection-like ABC-F family protein [Dysgonomonas termitidis]|uniref:Ribosomal protection-like ABC-F family protein n=1 Tax=Dysgonomonas termitidis TaxID=1516126 RepID=A0ABV9L3I4_9BACT
MCISVQQLSYIHPDKEELFQDISFSITKGQKVALIGDNGSGKSTLMHILKGDLFPVSGKVIRTSHPYYIPQHFGQYNRVTVAQALRMDDKLRALHAILNGDASARNFSILDDDWDIEERSRIALSLWGLDYIDFSTSLDSLSGGEITKLFLAGIGIHEPGLILFDEPTNHLDYHYRDKLYDFISSSRKTMLIISHDRMLLNMLPEIYELRKDGIAYYAGNYEFYKMQKEQEMNSLQAKLEEQEKELRRARKIAQEVAERNQKRDARNKKDIQQKGIARIIVNTLRNKAENSTAKQKDAHEQKMGSLRENIGDIRKSLPDMKSMKTDFSTSALHAGKILITAKDVNFGYGADLLWKNPLNFQIKSGERVLLRGSNGSGKTTLLQLLTRQLPPQAGILTTADFSYVYLDQEYSIINNDHSVYEQIRQFSTGLQEHEIKTILNRFLFSYSSWDKKCGLLSGGEKMKLALSCLMVSANTPDVFILDEPTNNIDIRNVEILTSTIRDYKGTILLVSHDQYFIGQMNIDYEIELQ